MSEEEEEKQLESLEEHEERKRKFHKMMAELTPNGIACPQCGAEMVDSDNVVLASMPQMRKIHCKNCMFRSTRIV